MRPAGFYQIFFPTVWVLWVIAWWAWALNVKATVRRQPLVPQVLNMLLLYGAGALLWSPRVAPALDGRFLPGAQWQFWAALGAALTLGGLLFTVWARIYLGRNWSGAGVTIKADHELVTGGPYGLVRHPIYSGLFLAFVGTTLAVGQWRGVLAVALALIAIVHRIIVEQRFMREQFGAAYDAYAKRVPAFIPWLI